MLSPASSSPWKNAPLCQYFCNNTMPHAFGISKGRGSNHHLIAIAACLQKLPLLLWRRNRGSWHAGGRCQSCLCLGTRLPQVPAKTTAKAKVASNPMFALADMARTSHIGKPSQHAMHTCHVQCAEAPAPSKPHTVQPHPPGRHPYSSQKHIAWVHPEACKQ